MVTTLLTGGRIHSPGQPDATAMAVADGAIVWVGADEPGHTMFGQADELVDLGGALVTPAFVDAHVHATGTGILLDGPDLTGSRSLTEGLDAVERHTTARSATDVVWASGWDDTRWPEGRPPTRSELDRAARGAAVYLPRIDAHSAVASSALLGHAPAAVGAPGWSADGPLTGQAHHNVRRAAREAIGPGQRREAQRRFLDHAAARGVSTVHECSGPDVAGADDLADLLSCAHGVEVVGYWGELVQTPQEATALLAATGAHGLAGDLFCDGSLGSRTAALRAPYADAPGDRGSLQLDSEQIAGHLVACTRAGTQAGFHLIGDAAADAVIDGFAAAERELGSAALRAAGHRLEHLEMVDAEQACRLARCGVVASVQPGFDAAWGGTEGMYAQRLGGARAAPMNPFALLASTGVGLAVGSDTPVTPVEPWAAVRAAVHHRTPGSGIGAAAAFDAHTSGGHRAAGQADSQPGALTPGSPATYVVWDAGELARQPGPPLPALTEDAPLPTCFRTVRRGRTIFDRLTPAGRR